MAHMDVALYFPNLTIWQSLILSLFYPYLELEWNICSIFMVQVWYGYGMDQFIPQLGIWFKMNNLNSIIDTKQSHN